ncbi:MAG: hypothetical protein M3Y76_04190 [Chloroflexota bacterium]|nr:hypothetical protein [Chloroflexota bacterium]
MGWLEARCQELEENGSLQPMFTIDGGHDLTEISNGAYKQQRLDVEGNWWIRSSSLIAIRPNLISQANCSLVFNKPDQFACSHF